MGGECIRKYKKIRKSPCFSHEEMVVHVNARTLLQDIIDREMKRREKVREMGRIKEEKLEEVKQCFYCRSFLFFSAVVGKEGIVCPAHASRVSSISSFQVRFPDKELLKL